MLLNAVKSFTQENSLKEIVVKNYLKKKDFAGFWNNYFARKIFDL
jgi:hypothetical protein